MIESLQRPKGALAESCLVSEVTCQGCIHFKRVPAPGHEELCVSLVGPDSYPCVKFAPSIEGFAVPAVLEMLTTLSPSRLYQLAALANLAARNAGVKSKYRIGDTVRVHLGGMDTLDNYKRAVVTGFIKSTNQYCVLIFMTEGYRTRDMCTGLFYEKSLIAPLPWTKKFLHLLSTGAKTDTTPMPLTRKPKVAYVSGASIDKPPCAEEAPL